jgi:hypothetical protein
MRAASVSTTLHEEIKRLQILIAALPDLDLRSPEEILGYDEFGC